MYLVASFTSDLSSALLAREGLSRLLFRFTHVRFRCVRKQHVDIRRWDRQQPFPQLLLP